VPAIALDSAGVAAATVGDEPDADAEPIAGGTSAAVDDAIEKAAVSELKGSDTSELPTEARDEATRTATDAASDPGAVSRNCSHMVDVLTVTPPGRTCAGETETEGGDDPDDDPSPGGGGGEPVTLPPAAETDLPDRPTTVAQALKAIEQRGLLSGETLRHVWSDWRHSGQADHQFKGKGEKPAERSG
jgi:hypothetical protein